MNVKKNIKKNYFIYSFCLWLKTIVANIVNWGGGESYI